MRRQLAPNYRRRLRGKRNRPRNGNPGRFRGLVVFNMDEYYPLLVNYALAPERPEFLWAESSQGAENQ